MSFSSEQKEKIINDQYKNACCRRALLSGILSVKATVDSDTVSFSLEKESYCEFSAKLISEFYGKAAKIESPRRGGRCKNVSFESKVASKYVRTLSEQELPFVQKCPMCASSYMKGVFLACGNISDPRKQYLCEFSPSVNDTLLLRVLSMHSFDAQTSTRHEKKLIYFKKASVIEDLCGFIGLTDAMFAITNTQIEREFLNNTNRIVNCETNNIGKAVSASAKQIEAIKALEAHNLLSSLPEELEYTARLRLKNDTLSLSQLSKIFTPPISKSGLSHRLSKLIEISEQMLKDK